jgi:hypothetical protein
VHSRWTAVVGFDDHLHSDPHAVLPAPAPASSANLRLTARRSKRAVRKIGPETYAKQR